MDRLRSRSLGLVLISIALVNVLQLWSALAAKAPRVATYGTFLGILGALTIFILLRVFQPKSGIAAMMICTLVSVEGFLDFSLGCSPITPFISWYPLFVFLCLTITGIRWGLLAALQLTVFSAFHLYFSLDLPKPLDVSSGAHAAGYTRGLTAVIIFSSILAYILVSLYEYFFNTTLKDLGHLQASRSQRKRLQLLSDFAHGIACDLEQPLRELEAFSERLRSCTDPGQLPSILREIRQCRLDVHKMNATTQRYLLLSAGRGVAPNATMTVANLFDFVLDFPSRDLQRILPSHRQVVRHGALSDRCLPHTLGRMVILVLCSAINRIEGSLAGRLHALTFLEQNGQAIFTLVFVAQKPLRLIRDLRDSLTDYNSTLESIRGVTRLMMPATLTGPASFTLSLPVDF